MKKHNQTQPTRGQNKKAAMKFKSGLKAGPTIVPGRDPDQPAMP